MDRSGDLVQRLGELFRKTVQLKGKQERPFYEITSPPAKVFVYENETSGKAEVECAIPDGCGCIQWQLTQTGLFQFLQKDKNADGTFLLHRASGELDAHVIECKTTVDQKRWSEMTEQMRWTLRKLMALVGAIDRRLDRVVLYTAYRFDQLSEKESPNPAAARRTIGPPEEQSPVEVELNAVRRGQLDWQRHCVRLRGFERPFHHRKIKLDERTGRGSVEFVMLD